MTVRTRFAPSPSGYLHVGNAWAAFFNWLFARHESGQFILRIEDTDQSRSTDESIQSILDDFHWLGIDWDEGPDTGGPAGPYRQTERFAFYRRHVQALLDGGRAYLCYCTPEELGAERKAAEAAGRPYRYSGRCRNLTDRQREAFEREGRRPTIRLRVTRDEPIVVHDLILGDVTFEPSTLDDAILVRSDGSPLYNFANVVDDHLMAITHIIRANEHLSNTPKQLLIYDAFGWTPPEVAHLPMILGPDRRKLSKRHGATSVRDYRRQGYLPEALLNFFALLGWHPEENREIYSV
ncbi:MAG: glutamate--tRNA ligase, partial [bacterium]